MDFLLSLGGAGWRGREQDTVRAGKRRLDCGAATWLTGGSDGRCASPRTGPFQGALWSCLLVLGAVLALTAVGGVLGDPGVPAGAGHSVAWRGNDGFFWRNLCLLNLAWKLAGSCSRLLASRWGLELPPADSSLDAAPWATGTFVLYASW